MNIKVVSYISAKGLLGECGVGVGGQNVQRGLVNECVKEMDRYVPMQTGTTKNTRTIEKDGVTYHGPHARYIYHGILMLAPNGSSWAKKGERKHSVGRPLSYHGEPTRGPYWDKRMWADKGTAVCHRIARRIGGRAT